MCLLDLLCCCVGPAACGLCCGGCGGKAKSSILTRLLYLSFLVVIVLVSAILLAPDVQDALEKDAVSLLAYFSNENKAKSYFFSTESALCQLQPNSEGPVKRRYVSNGDRFFGPTSEL